MLCTLAELKLHINFAGSTHDTLLTALIEEASGVINAETRRQIEIANITEFHDGEFRNEIILHEFPVASEATFTVTEDGEVISSDDFVVNYDEGVLRLLDGATFSEGEANVKVVYRAGFNVTGSPVAGETDLPLELRLACKVIAGKFFQLRETLGVSQKRFESGTISYKKALDEDIKSILERHQRKIVG